MLWGDVKTFCSDTRIKILSFICRREVSEIERETERQRERAGDKNSSFKIIYWRFIQKPVRAK